MNAIELHVYTRVTSQSMTHKCLDGKHDIIVECLVKDDVNEAAAAGGVVYLKMPCT